MSSSPHKKTQTKENKTRTPRGHVETQIQERFPGRRYMQYKYASNCLPSKYRFPGFLQVEKLRQGHITVIFVNSKFSKHLLLLFRLQNDAMSS